MKIKFWIRITWTILFGTDFTTGKLDSDGDALEFTSPVDGLEIHIQPLRKYQME